MRAAGESNLLEFAGTLSGVTRMGRPPKEWAAIGLPPLREYWREINRQERQARAHERAKRKTRDKKRRKCQCEAYPWPHRPGGGLCRSPNPPLERWQAKHDRKHRPYRRRYAGIRRQIARANGLHPIKDRAAIEALMAGVMALAKRLKHRYPTLKYRNMEITETGLRGNLQTAGPMM
jgi:hypothetical protein